MRIGGICCQHYVKTIENTLTELESIQCVKESLRNTKAFIPFDALYLTTIAKTGFEVVKHIRSILLNLVGGVLLILFSITGCSDSPHLGSMLTVDDVDRYFTSTESSVCLLNGTEPSCVTLVVEESDVTDDITGPIIHIHPNKIIYVFYRNGVTVLRAERATDTGDAVGGGGTVGGNSGNGGNGENDNNVPDADPGPVDTHRVYPVDEMGDLIEDKKVGWIVWIDYEDGRPEGTGIDLDSSGFKITILDENGIDITDQVTYSTQTSGPGGDSVQFFVATESNKITVQVKGLEDDYEAEFTMEPPPDISPENTTFQTNPLEPDNN